MSNETTYQIQPQQSSAVDLIREAMASKADPAYLRELLSVRREWESDEARKAFNKAISEFQRRAPIVEKADKAYDKDYAKLERIWRTIRPLLTELGLSVTWQVAEMREGLCHVEGQLRHKDGHGERLVMDIPIPELIKGQNKAQQAGSAHSYARRYAMCAALGIVTGKDDDGHAAGSVFITHEQAEKIDMLVQACRGLNDFKEAAFWGWIGATKSEEIAADRFVHAKGQLEKKLKEANK